MSREELLERLRALHGLDDPEIAHGLADELLLAFIGDAEVREAFELVDRWYA